MTADADRALLTASLQRVGRGDRAALEDVYKRTSGKLFGVCLRILHDQAEAEDVLQDVYLTVWRKADQFDPGRASPITWLAALARNRAIDRLRSKGGRVFVSEDAAAEAPDPSPWADARLETSQEAKQLKACLGELEPTHAHAVRTAFFGGQTYDQLARAMDVPLGTMKGWIRRSLARLKACLEGAA